MPFVRGSRTLHLPCYPHSMWTTPRTDYHAQTRVDPLVSPCPTVDRSARGRLLPPVRGSGGLLSVHRGLLPIDRHRPARDRALGCSQRRSRGHRGTGLGSARGPSPRCPRPDRRRRPLVGSRRDVAGGHPRADHRRDCRRDARRGLCRSRPDARQPHDPDRRQESGPIRTGTGIRLARLHDLGARHWGPDRGDRSAGPLHRLHFGAVPDGCRRLRPARRPGTGWPDHRENHDRLRVRVGRPRSRSDAAALLHRLGPGLDRRLGRPHVPLDPPRPARREQRPRRPRLDARRARRSPTDARLPAPRPPHRRRAAARPRRPGVWGPGGPVGPDVGSAPVRGDRAARRDRLCAVLRRDRHLRFARGPVQATAQGLFSGTAFSIGAILGSVVGGQLAAALTIPGMFAVSAAGTAAGAAIVLWATEARKTARRA